MMTNDVQLEVCCIAEQGSGLSQLVQDQLSELFDESFYIHASTKQENEVDIVIAEVRGKGNWRNEDELLGYIEEKADEAFLLSIHGVNVNVLNGKKGCSCCG
jgi:hypothetical protein